MEKFFNFVFKFGKVISIVFVVCFLLTATVTGIIGCTKFKTYKTEIPTFMEILNKKEHIQNAYTKTDKKQTPEYITIVDEFIKANDFTNEVKNLVLATFSDIPDEQKIEYANGLKIYLTEFNQYSHTKGVKKEFLYVGKLQDYLYSYKSNYLVNNEIKSYQEEKQNIERITVFSIFGLSILLFILALIVPLLIKIEENTRK